MRKFYVLPAAIDGETDKSFHDENLGWLPKSKIEITSEKDNNGLRWMTIPAWLLTKKGIYPYMSVLKGARVIYEKV